MAEFFSRSNYTEKSSSVTENKYTQPDHVSPLASPVQQPQNTPFGKQEYYGSQQQLPQQQLPPQQLQQQQQQQQFAPQQQQQQQQQPPQQMYQTAVNLANLQEAPAPVDCPVCRHRALTVVDMHAGNTTQYVLPPPLLSPHSMCDFFSRCTQL